MKTNQSQNNSNLRGWQIFFAIIALEGLATCVRLILIPADPKNALLFGFSASRLGMLGLALAITGLAAWLAVQTAQTHWLARLCEPRLFKLSICVSLLLAAGCWATLAWLQAFPVESYPAIHARLAPLFTWFILLGAQSAIWLPVARFGLQFHWLPAQKPIRTPALIALGSLLLLWLLVALTQVGITPDEIDFGRRGVPLLSWQVLFCSGILFAALLISARRRTALSAQRQRRLDWILAAAFWLLAVASWLAMPIPMRGRAPNYEVYPSRDSALYDSVAHSILIGNGYLVNQITVRPLYILAVAGFHGVAGDAYPNLIAAQTVLLAMLPVGLYFLGRRLHSRALGIFLALLGIIRELNTISASGYGITSNSKMILSDLPTTVLIIFLTLMVVRWLQEPQRSTFPALAAGGLLGMTMLIRTQAVILIPVIFLLALFTYGKRWLPWLKTLLIFLSGLMLVISPWLMRSYRLTGSPVFDSPVETAGIIQRFNTSYDTFKPMPGESDSAYSARTLRAVVDFSLANPGKVIGFVASHFFNNTISSVLMLPYRFDPLDYRDMLIVKTAFWHPWTVELTGGRAALLLLNLSLVALGLAEAWRRWRWAGLVPLGFFVIYNLSCALARISGYRYILPVDWVAYLYAGLGLAVLFSWMLAALQQGSPEPAPLVIPSGRPRSAPLIILGAALLMVGSALPLSEVLIPKRFPIQQPQGIVERLAGDPTVQQAGVTTQMLQAFASQPKAALRWGRALYPVYRKAGEGKPKGNNDDVFAAQSDFDRLNFSFVTTQRETMVIELKTMPAYFPNAVDAIVIGCQEKDYLDAWLILLPGEQPVLYRSDAAFSGVCPLQHAR